MTDRIRLDDLTSDALDDLYEQLAQARAALAGAPVAPDDMARRDRIADAIRDAACTGDCGQTEHDCARTRIQPFAWHHGQLASVDGSPEMFADAALTALQPELERLAAVARLRDDLHEITGARWIADALDTILNGPA